MSILTLDKVDKEYFGGYTGVSGVSFSVDKGERLAIFGKRGSGKSTLLKLIATLETPTSGSITIDDRNVSDMKTEELGIAYATSELPLFRHKTVYDNLAYPLSIRKTDKDVIRKRVLEISSLFHLDGILDERARYLDESTAGRVIIARAFMRDADFYLFDNVLEHLTIEDRDEVMSIFSHIIPDIEGAIIYATDRLDEVRLIAGDNVVMLASSHMIERGSLGAIYRDPETLEGIRLLTDGGVNELVRRVDVDDKGYYIELMGRRYIDINDVYLGKDIIVAVLPEEVRIDSDGDIEARVTRVYRGVRTDIALLEVGAETLVIEANGLHVEDSVRVRIGDILLYDIKAERRIIV